MGDLLAKTGVEHILWLMLLITTVAIITKYVRLPYTIALVITGLIVALLPTEVHEALSVPLTSDLILFIFLPALLFEGSYNLNFSHLHENIRTVTILAVLGVLATSALVGLAVHYMLGLDWTVSFLFGAIVSSTDPIAVLAIFRQLGVPPRLASIVEGESLFNDGTSLVVFSIILGILQTGQFDLVAGIGQFVLLTVGGIVVGVALGLICTLLLERIDDHLVETVITLMLAYGTYIIAETLGVSGVIAVVAAGLVIGNYGARRGMSASTRIAVSYTWDLLGFLANSLIFILIGLQLKIELLGKYIGPVLVAVVGTLVARALVVYGLDFLLLRRIEPPLPKRWLPVLTWGGLRGALALAIVLSVPPALLSAGMGEELVAMTFGVILFSLVGQGLTIYPLLRRLGLCASTSEAQLEYENSYALLMTTSAARRQLAYMEEQGEIGPEVADDIRSEYDALEQQLRTKVHQLSIESAGLAEREKLAVRRELIQTEKASLRRLAARGFISGSVQQRLAATLDQQLEELGQPGSDAAVNLPEYPV